MDSVRHPRLVGWLVGGRPPWYALPQRSVFVAKGNATSRWRRIGGPHTVVVPAPVFEGREEKEERDVGGF